MQVLLKTETRIDEGPALLDHLESVVAEALGHYGARISLVEAYLADAPGGALAGRNGVHCTLAAHPVGNLPVVIKDQAATTWLVIHSALRKLVLALASARELQRG